MSQNVIQITHILEPLKCGKPHRPCVNGHVPLRCPWQKT